jgi:hypothetical protein
MLIIFHGLEGRYCTESFWSNIDPEDDDNDEDEVYGPMDDANDTISLTKNYISDLSHAIEGIQFSTSEFMFQFKIDNLIFHHHKQFTMELLMWPKSFKKWKKKEDNV